MLLELAEQVKLRLLHRNEPPRAKNNKTQAGYRLDTLP
jgi:hypothetical protein